MFASRAGQHTGSAGGRHRLLQLDAGRREPRSPGRVQPDRIPPPTAWPAAVALIRDMDVGDGRAVGRNGARARDGPGPLAGAGRRARWHGRRKPGERLSSVALASSSRICRGAASGPLRAARREGQHGAAHAPPPTIATSTWNQIRLRHEKRAWTKNVDQSLPQSPAGRMRATGKNRFWRRQLASHGGPDRQNKESASSLLLSDIPTGRAISAGSAGCLASPDACRTPRTPSWTPQAHVLVEHQEGGLALSSSS